MVQLSIHDFRSHNLAIYWFSLSEAENSTLGNSQPFNAEERLPWKTPCDKITFNITFFKLMRYYFSYSIKYNFIMISSHFILKGTWIWTQTSSLWFSARSLNKFHFLIFKMRIINFVYFTFVHKRHRSTLYYAKMEKNKYQKWRRTKTRHVCRAWMSPLRFVLGMMANVFTAFICYCCITN